MGSGPPTMDSSSRKSRCLGGNLLVLTQESQTSLTLPEFDFECSPSEFSLLDMQPDRDPPLLPRLKRRPHIRRKERPKRFTITTAPLSPMEPPSEPALEQAVVPSLIRGIPVAKDVYLGAITHSPHPAAPQTLKQTPSPSRPPVVPLFFKQTPSSPHFSAVSYYPQRWSGEPTPRLSFSWTTTPDSSPRDSVFDDPKGWAPLVPGDSQNRKEREWPESPQSVYSIISDEGIPGADHPQEDESVYRLSDVKGGHTRSTGLYTWLQPEESTNEIKRHDTAFIVGLLRERRRKALSIT
ncbi:hypothetical protein K439DRAFT_1655966 [Ramaria rubella]|nr:hypothetical protein K439DRAFT_1655966 [Ramaria rubella]